MLSDLRLSTTVAGDEPDLTMPLNLTGPENPWLVQAYVHAAKHPFASVVGQEVFQSGVIPSDTDFRIYRDFGHIPGMT